MPDIDAEPDRDADAWDVVSFETRPGDIVVFHRYCLHGRAPIDERTPNRHTLVLRFFGDDATYGALSNTDWPHIESQVTGAPFRSSQFVQLL